VVGEAMRIPERMFDVRVKPLNVVLKEICWKQKVPESLVVLNKKWSATFVYAREIEEESQNATGQVA
jgi:hypothetical protein